jgi:hypothetical protein
MRHTTLISLTVLGAMGALQIAARGAYTVERVVGGLHQVIAMAQAPGDGTSLCIDFDGARTAADWSIFSANASPTCRMSSAEAYGKGDRNADGVNDFRHFRVFKRDYDIVLGPGAFAAPTGIVPEPHSALLVSCGL